MRDIILVPFNIMAKRHHLRKQEEISSFQRSFLFAIFTLYAFVTNRSPSTAFLIPVSSTLIESHSLCPNPQFWEDSSTSLFPYLLANNNAVVPMELRHSDNKSQSYLPLPCRFRVGGSGVKPGTVLLLSLSRRKNPIEFFEPCSRVFQFPMLTRLESCITSTLPPGEEGSNRSELESPQRIATLGQLQWSPEGGLSFELPNVLPNGAQEEASFIVALFRITTILGECELHLQQYQISNNTSCAEILGRSIINDVCGRIPCSKESRILEQFQRTVPVHSLVDEEIIRIINMRGTLDTERAYYKDKGEFGERPVRPVGYYLKGLILPCLMTIFATISYFIWKKRVKASEAAANEINRQRRDNEGNQNPTEEEGALIVFENEDGFEPEQEKPPTYESLLEPPTYEQATSQNGWKVLESEELRELLRPQEPEESDEGKLEIENEDNVDLEASSSATFTQLAGTPPPAFSSINV